MKAIATFHHPTSVVGSLKTTLTDDEDTEYLVVAKSSILEVFAILPDALRLQCVLEIWGRITSLQAVPTDVSLGIIRSCHNRLRRGRCRMKALNTTCLS